MANRTLIQAFFDTAARRGSAVALRHRVEKTWVEQSWTDYAKDVRRFGRALMHSGIEAGEHIAILGPNRPEWVIAAVGAMAAGCSAAGIYGTSTADQVAYIAAHAGCKLAVVQDHKQLGKFRAEAATVPELKTFVLMKGEPAAPDEVTFAQFLARGDEGDVAASDKALDARWQALTPKSPSMLIYTSGTTGTPKAVIITHENVVFAAESTKLATGISEQEQFLSYLPLSHIAEQVLTLHGPAVVGFTVSFCEDLNQLGDFLREVRPTVFFGVPRVWEKMESKMKEAGKSGSGFQKKVAAWARGVGLKTAQRRQDGKSPPMFYGMAKSLVFSKVRQRLGFDRCWLCISGAAAISRSTLEFFFSLDLPILEVYGMSEVTGPGTLATPQSFRIGSVGKVLPGAELKLAEDGEILMRGPHVCAGYLKDSEATAALINAEGWLHSGDIGEIDKDGFLRVTDRKKDLFKTSGGKYIAPQPLEGLLKGIPGVGQAVVVGEGRKYAAALLTLDPDACKAEGRTSEVMAADPSVKARIEAEVAKINKTLPPYETIKKVFILPNDFSVESGEMTPSLKIKRKVVNQRYAANIESLYEGSAGAD